MSKLKIKYPEYFKLNCFNYLRHFMDIRLLTSAMDHGRDNIVRYYLENALDDPELYVNHMNDEGDRVVANAKINAYKQRQELYTDYMELLTKTEDENVRSKLLR
tara:strand:+ start:1581 stop:1892 length:312 start_codon:yes stop_codon:yes gene_type:complete